MPREATIEQTVEDAAAEAMEADALVATLRERVLGGDPDVKPDDLEAARRLAEFAGLRAEAAKRRQAEAEAASATAEVTAAVAEAVSVASGTPAKALEKAKAQAVRTFQAYAEAVEAHHEQTTATINRVRVANRDAHACNVPTSDAFGVSLATTGGAMTVEDGEGRITLRLNALSDPERIVGPVIEAGGFALTPAGSSPVGRRKR